MRVENVGDRVYGPEFSVQGSGVMAQGSGCRLEALRMRGQG